MKNILVLSPHPDDESIGCGGTIYKHHKDGDSVTVIYLTSGERAHIQNLSEAIIAIRENEAREAKKILHFNHIEFWHEPDDQFLVTEKIINRLFNKILELKPDIIYVTHENEYHIDHKKAFNLLKSVLAMPLLTVKPQVLLYEVWTPLQQIDVTIDITDFIDIKTEAIRAYKSQCAELRYDESSKALNRFRGELYSRRGGDYAESFTEFIYE